MKDEEQIQNVQSENEQEENFILHPVSLFLRFCAALTFLTRVPLPKTLVFDAADVGRSTLFFPLVGAAIGLVQAGIWLFFQAAAKDDIFRSILAAIVVVIVGVLLTGALHLDGLADMADGFGGQTKERTLEIMRDSLIGSYGATALILILLLKTAAIAALMFEFHATQFLILAPALARWASVPLGKFMRYARSEGGLGKSITDFVGWFELIGATVIVAVLIFVFPNLYGNLALWFAVILLTGLNALVCWRKIGGVTGDTMGANTEICETAVLLAAVFLRI